MSDPLRLWELCPHDHKIPHEVWDGGGLVERCPGGREVVLRRVPPDTNAAPLLQQVDAGAVYVEVTNES